jgi:CRISPR-associated endonuclease Csn1
MTRQPEFQEKKLGPLTFGFDIGIASVGWAVLSPTRIVDLGVRCFTAAEVPDTGEPLNAKRRTDKTARKRLDRRAQRLRKLRRLLFAHKLVDSAKIESFEAPSIEKKTKDLKNPWALRALGLDSLLDPQDWARVIVHIVKHRGFFSTRKSERVVDTSGTDKAKEKNGLLNGIAATEKKLSADGVKKYRTLGEMAFKHEEFANAKRNKDGDYKKSFSRILLLDELTQLFAAQRKFGSPVASIELERAVAEIFFQQKPAVTGENMLKMIGHCTFEKGEFRAPKFSYSAERFIWLSKLAALRINDGGDRRALTAMERTAAIDLPYANKTGKITYKQLRAAIDLPKSDAIGFVGLPYGSKKKKSGEDADVEEATLIELKAWPALRKALEGAGLNDDWLKLSVRPDVMDKIAYVLSVYQTDDEIAPKLKEIDLSDAIVDELLKLDFKNFIAVSIKALEKILPFLELGQIYSEACTNAGYNHAKPDGETLGLKYLPKLNFKDIRNPVVFRALNQSRNVLNALIRKHGSPSAVHIELARDLSKPYDERKQIEKDQLAYQKQRQDAEALFRDAFGGNAPNPRNQDLLKFRLYKEQDGKCGYSQSPLDLDRITEQGYVEVDHALPYSRSFDDSLLNKVLVLTKENREKKNQTPYEYLGGASESPKWRTFEAAVLGNKKYRQAKRARLLRKEFVGAEEEGFKERNLNDTRWIVKFFAAEVRQKLAFAPDESGETKKVPVLTPAGGFTSFLRTRWGLHKDREASDLHHVQDACVIAAASHALIKRVSDYNRRKETHEVLSGGAIVDKSTGEILQGGKDYFPEPWAHFRDEVKARLSLNPSEGISNYFAAYSTDDVAALKPILVSRAVKRRAGGAVHQDTVRSIKPHLGPQTSSKRTWLRDLTLEKLERIVGAHDPRNAGLIRALRERLEDFKGDGKKAFADTQPPVHKPRSDGTDGPIIRAVQLTDVQKGGVPVRGGVADQASMWRVDVFRKDGKHYLVPIYQADRRKGATLPDRASTANTPRSEWTEIDDSFEFRFSMAPNDFIVLKTKKAEFSGYFAGLDIATAAISIYAHDRNATIGKDGLWRSLGVKVGTVSFEKSNIDVLGSRYAAKQEYRRGLA